MNTLELKDEHGKELPKSWLKSLGKLINEKQLLPEYEESTELMLTNPYSGVSVKASPLCAAICLWITRTNPIRHSLTRSDWDHARFIVNVCWPKVYYAIID